ncbi:hypothetical protein TSTA_049740 [Talaromyces stipitatus ATCC 10500]|uniref:Uncharacterized protein n=1 Tax=Talaromyces stipitatus (strain ATCC 10500 / CBS 375.48 / QM 6759 / NRRL 1006) TaxID=441959 RepID=B8MLK3_TALSN|nr:uncharacterized protein TSTA_049740 [Talaromyces stipitatus ATCC 10500]EED15536.1 hypothetical protein TSTA_049740 [Talaromyces stipitatus ATCC 10500]
MPTGGSVISWMTFHITKLKRNLSYDLIVRLICMLDVGKFRNAYSGRRNLVWRKWNFEAFVKEIFSEDIQLEHDKIKLGPLFNRVQSRTDNQPVLPSSPKSDPDTEKWYKRQYNTKELDFDILRCGSFPGRIHEYKYWHNRLVILKEAFDKFWPSTMSQWWNDRRDGIQ